MTIPMSSPDISDLEIQNVSRVLQSQYLSGGPYLSSFERKIAELAGTKHAIVVSSGTAALHLIMLALGIKTNDEVITSPYSFIASANCILYVGATPVFCDINTDDLNINPDLIESQINEKTKAILVVHVFGTPARMDRIMQIAQKHNLLVIEDSCEAIGAKANGKPVGGIGSAGTFAFYPNKQITTGEGGAIVINDDSAANLIRSLANQGRDNSQGWLHHIHIGYNYRLSELACAIGDAQMERLSGILKQRARVAGWYGKELKNVSELAIPNAIDLSPDSERSWFVYVIRFKKPEQRDFVADCLAKEGIETRPYFPSIHLQPAYRKLFNYKSGTFPVAEIASATSLALPFFTKMPRESVIKVCNSIKSALSE